MSKPGVIPPSPQHRAEEVVRHVLREVHAGRSLHDVMQDSYVTERAEADTHSRVFDHPEVTEAVGADIVAELRRLLES